MRLLWLRRLCGWLLGLGVVGCSGGARNDAMSEADSAASPPQEVVVFPSLPVVDDNDAALKAHDIEDLRGTLAVLSESIGVEAAGGLFSPFIHAGTIIPMQQTEVMSTAHEGQQGLEFGFFRGVGRRVNENRPIGKVLVVGIPPQKAGAPRIELKLRIQLTGDLQVSARDLASGKPLLLRQISP